MIIKVYAERVKEVSKKLDRLAKKAEEYGVPCFYTVGEEHPWPVRVLAVDPVTQVLMEVGRHTVGAVDIDIKCDGLIRSNGWTVRARVEHLNRGNVVTAFGCKAKPEWYKAEANCDHCGTKRYRSMTFFVEHEDGSIRQVGRNRLKDYTGIDPARAAIWAEVQGYNIKGVDCMVDEWNDWQMAPMYEALQILAHAADVVREFGYCKSCEPDSTKEKVEQRMMGCEPPSEEGLDEARKVVDWLLAKNPDEASDLERNCIALVATGYAKRQHFGRLVYMPVAYARHIEKQNRKKAAVRSEYVGEVGEHILIKISEMTLLSTWCGYYGMVWMYKFVDEAGNIYVWKASKAFSAEKGAIIKATVKDHSEWLCEKQTIVTRCSLAAA